MTSSPTHGSLSRILLWLLLALIFGLMALVVDGCHRPAVFQAPVIGRPLPVPHIQLGRRGGHR
jgi:hypothetical protein